jgi:hypothetical protein
MYLSKLQNVYKISLVGGNIAFYMERAEVRTPGTPTYLDEISSH